MSSRLTVPTSSIGLNVRKGRVCGREVALRKLEAVLLRLAERFLSLGEGIAWWYWL